MTKYSKLAILLRGSSTTQRLTTFFRARPKHFRTTLFSADPVFGGQKMIDLRVNKRAKITWVDCEGSMRTPSPPLAHRWKSVIDGLFIFSNRSATEDASRSRNACRVSLHVCTHIIPFHRTVVRTIERS